MWESSSDEEEDRCCFKMVMLLVQIPVITTVAVHGGVPFPDTARSGFSPVAVAGKNVSGSARRPVFYGFTIDGIDARTHII